MGRRLAAGCGSPGGRQDWQGSDGCGGALASRFYSDSALGPGANTTGMGVASSVPGCGRSIPGNLGSRPETATH